MTKTRYVPMRNTEPLGPPMSRTAAIKVLRVVVKNWRENDRVLRGRFSAPKNYRRIDAHTADIRFPEWELRQNERCVAKMYLQEEGNEAQ